MRVLSFALLLLQLLPSALAQFNFITQFLLLNKYGQSQRDCRRVPFPPDGGPPRRRCRRTKYNNPFFNLALVAALNPPTPAPAAPAGCFPDAMTLERQTEDGSEVVSVADLTLGDNVRCLFAPKGPRTVTPELGWCKFEVRGHNSNSSMMFEQLLFLDDQGEERMIAATGTHMLWRSTDTTLKGTVDPKKISLQNDMFVPIMDVKPGDVIIYEHDNQWSYHNVTAHRQEEMAGIRNPGFSDGGLPIVSGVLATTSVTTYRGGHWGAYYQYIWNKDSKFNDTTAVFWDYRTHPFSLAQRAGILKVDLDCVMDHLFKDMDKGVDVTNFTSYGDYVEAYLLPCVNHMPSLAEVGRLFLTELPEEDELEAPGD